MEARLRRLRSALRAARRSAGAYPATLQREVAAVAVARRGAGHGLWSTAEAAVPVVVDDSLVLVTSQGHRVEGLTTNQLVSVLRGLARCSCRPVASAFTPSPRRPT